MHSNDCSNLVSANTVLRRLHSFVKENHVTLTNILSNKGNNIDWHLISSRSPHFRGFWESHVKLVKNHLLRVIGKALLTFEQFYTLLTQIE